jgi:acid phosphatase family membrane protein YuiD
MTAVLRRLVFTTHVTSSVGWAGSVCVFIALAAAGLTSQHEPTVRGAYLLMAPAAWLVLVPLAHASLLSGLAISLGTSWGLFRHYWIVIKLAITAFSTVILLIYMGTFRQMAGVAADPVVELGLVKNPSPMVHGILALALLLTATILSVYKPFGMTTYGLRKQQARSPNPPRDPGIAVSARRSSRSQLSTYAIWILVGIGILLVAAHTILGGVHHQ